MKGTNPTQPCQNTRPRHWPCIFCMAFPLSRYPLRCSALVRQLLGAHPIDWKQPGWIDAVADPRPFLNGRQGDEGRLI